MPVLGEYRNQNSQRQYPFADDAPLTDNTEQRLSVDFLVDAFLYPIDITGRPYLSKIDLGEGTLHFSDSETAEEIGVASFNINDTEAYIYEQEYDRKIGVLAFGDGLSSVFAGATVRVFVPESTPLAPTAFIPLNQPGVRGFLLPDGNLVTGDVVFEGRDGVLVSSTNTIGGIPILRIDVIGVPETPLDVCRDVCDVITELLLQRKAGSAVDISEYGGNVIALVGSGFDLGDICQTQKLRRLPDAEGNLPPGEDICTAIPPDPPEPYPDADDEVLFVMADPGVGPYFLITNPSSVGNLNPISIKSLAQLGITDAPRLMQSRPVNSVSDLDDQIRAFTNPSFMADGICIGIRGLANSKRARQ